jgi:acyl carrier protein
MSLTARIDEDLGMDSLDLLSLAIEAQARFGIEIGDAALANVRTVGDFQRCVVDAIRGCPLASRTGSRPE